MIASRMVLTGGLGLVLGAASIPAPVLASSSEAPPNGAKAADTLPFTANDLLWMEVRADELQLAESMDVYSSRTGVYVPVGQFARVLDLAVAAFPAEGRVEGWILSPERALKLELATRTASVGGRRVRFDANDAITFAGDIYVKLELAEQLLPVRLRADTSAQLLTVTATEKLPFERRRELARRRGELAAPAASVRPATVRNPYRLFSAPAFDVNIGAQMTRDGTDQSNDYAVRATGDLAYATFRGFLGSDSRGKLNDVRLSLERKSPGDDALGPLGGVRACIGDVFTPAAAIGVASVGGRGVFYSSAPLETADLSTPLDLRGELAPGEEVELYVNETLRASQATPVSGRYEFLKVPLSFGLNVIRLVFYGPQGRRREEVRRINLGAGQMQPHRLMIRLGAVQQDVPVIGTVEHPTWLQNANARVTALLDYGLAPRLTVSGGVARYTPFGLPSRTLGLAGARAALGAVALQVDAGADDRGGLGATLGLAGRAANLSVVARHSEYRGGFVDETRQPGLAADLLLRRASDLHADLGLRVSGSTTIPLSLDVRRMERSDGKTWLTSSVRSSAPLGAFYVSASLAQQHDGTAPVYRDRLLASAEAGRTVASRVQLRTGLSYQLTPTLDIDSAYALADFRLAPNTSLSVGAARSAGPRGDTSLQAAHVYRARWCDVASAASYDTRSGQWRLGLQLAFALARDPRTRRYGLMRPGVTSSGAIAINAFVDENGDGVRQAGEHGMRGVGVDTPMGPMSTDQSGWGRVEGLGDAGAAALRINTSDAEDPFLTGAPETVQITPRPGTIATIDLPLRRSAEVEVVALLQRVGSADAPLAALDLQLLPIAGGAPIGARTDHAGVATFEGVPADTYAVAIEPHQMETLGLAVAEPVRVTVAASGGFVRAGKIRITLAGKKG